ncbi:MAG: lamin tail domain-containing protein [Spirochaetales bacterium]|nr:lamin tail domain-containing protein [Spirochaetales bacterium]
MSYTLIKGSFHIYYPENPLSGPEPDGDTLKFEPDSRDLIYSLPRANKSPKFTKKGITTIRFEGIDALETHFPIEGEEYHQNMKLAIAARDKLLDLAGFGMVTYWEEKPNKVKSVEYHPIRGYLLSNGLDIYGRTIAFVFIGDHPEVDGAKLFVRPEMIEMSLNTLMLKKGYAYPAFYLSLPADLRMYLKSIAESARKTETGLWRYDTVTVNKSETIVDLAHFQQLVMWPKVFRRLAAYYHEGYTDLGKFHEWLRKDPADRDDRVLFPNLELGNMHDLIIVNNNKMSLTHLPADIVIVPDDFVLPEAPVTPVHIGAGSIRIIAALINPREQPEQGHEVVTLINITDKDIDVSEWFIADSNGKQKCEGVISKGSVMQVTLGGSVRLSNIRDTITLLDDQETIIDQVSYEEKDLPGEGFTKVF